VGAEPDDLPYAGVMNYMGASFTRDEPALALLLGEVGDRGLYYLDDGSSPESRAAAVGEEIDVPVLTADRILDKSRVATAIEAELEALESIAQTRGIAIGVASAFPASVAVIETWLAEAEARGIVLVPASAALSP
jgi:polysaccharide deacetylase 2 family uncharacterized protein YibQ